MTVYEALFGSPEAAARTFKEGELNQLDICYMMDALSKDRGTRCSNCLYEYDRYGCCPREIDVVDWLNQEVVE